VILVGNLWKGGPEPGFGPMIIQTSPVSLDGFLQIRIDNYRKLTGITFFLSLFVYFEFAFDYKTLLFQ
jgi:hypothetical protein